MRQRYAKVPWLIPQEDLQPQGDPETAVFLSGSTLVGLHIKGLEGHLMLGVREDAHGQPVSCAITNEVQIDAFTRVPAQSNPRRHMDTNGDEA